MRTNKEIDDKYIRFKECLLKTKSNLNKLVDDVSDVLRRGQPVNKSKKSTSVEVKKSESTDKNDSQVSNENASSAAAVETTAEAAPEEEEASANNTVEVNNLENGGDQVLESQINENTNCEQLEQNVEDENEENQDEKKMDLSSNDN